MGLRAGRRGWGERHQFYTDPNPRFGRSAGTTGRGATNFGRRNPGGPLWLQGNAGEGVKAQLTTANQGVLGGKTTSTEKRT